MKTNIHSSIIHLRGLSAFAAILSIGAFSSSASADVVIADYDFTGGSAASGDTDSFTAAGDYIGTVSPNTSTYSGISSGSNNAYFFSFQTADSLSNAITANDYQSFTLDLESTGATVSLDTLTFDQAWWNTDTTLDFGVSVLIGTSAADFDEASDSIFDFTIDGAGYTNGANASVAQNVDLSGIVALQNLSSDVEVRFYFYDNSSATDRTHRIDNITLTASSVIPEPSSVALVFACVSLGATACMRRGKRNVSYRK